MKNKIKNDVKIKYDVTTDNIHIKDNYKITKEKEMKRILNLIKLQYYSSQYFFYLIPLKDLINEWKTHNLFYDLHLFRSYTKDVDLNKHSWFIKLIYSILSKFYIKSWFK
jgi:hypothetical protein